MAPTPRSVVHAARPHGGHIGASVRFGDERARAARITTADATRSNGESLVSDRALVPQA